MEKKARKKQEKHQKEKSAVLKDKNYVSKEGRQKLL